MKSTRMTSWHPSKRSHFLIAWCETFKSSRSLLTGLGFTRTVACESDHSSSLLWFENHLSRGGQGNYTDLQPHSLEHETLILRAPFTTTGAEELQGSFWSPRLLEKTCYGAPNRAIKKFSPHLPPIIININPEPTIQ